MSADIEQLSMDDFSLYSCESGARVRTKRWAVCMSDKCLNNNNQKWSGQVEKPNAKRNAIDCVDCGQALVWKAKTETIQPLSSRWKPFSEAREFVRSLGLQNQDEWELWAKSNKRPRDIPSTPHKTYKHFGYISTIDWLGSEKTK